MIPIYSTTVLYDNTPGHCFIITVMRRLRKKDAEEEEMMVGEMVMDTLDNEDEPS